MIKINFIDKNEKEIKQIKINKENLIKRRRKKSILEIAIENNIPMKYGCMGGSCGACISKIINGEEYLNIEGMRKLVYKGLKENEFLPCIAQIKEEYEDKDIEIKIQLLL
jgi:ferredoxin